MTTQTHTLNARGLNCPLPILRTRKAIAKIEAGEILVLRQPYIEGSPRGRKPTHPALCSRCSS